METSLPHITILSPNHSGKRTAELDTFTPHCVVGQATAERIGEIFAPKAREASCNYGIGLDGRIVLVVDENNRSWCTSSNANDQRAITVEVASDNTHPYAFRDAAYEALIELAVDIGLRTGRHKWIWKPDKDYMLGYKPARNEMRITVHRWFANKSCPGDWLYSRLGEFAAEVTRRIEAKLEPAEPPKIDSPSVWAADGWQWAIENGITDGTRPREYATREQVAEMIRRAWSKQT